ncbi:MAG: serine hydrolase [Pirellulaceae bacterium]|jgi:CubicO group peptidase (beta-lactamase class C family)|nr:serine hydrolase [Pirellulaceae bacterium]MDP7019723.1 serine hydrolase [Pirellulaceae bacterium]
MKRSGLVAALCNVAMLAGMSARAADVWPDAKWRQVDASDVGLDAQKLAEARDYALTGGGSGYITRHGKLVLRWGDTRRRYDLKSTTKSIGVTALGIAIGDGKIQLSDPVVKHHPNFAVPPESNRRTGWIDKITIEQLATQTAGFEKPGGYRKLQFEPGSKWDYSDGGPNWLAECVALAYQRDVSDLMFDRVFRRLGITEKDLTWRRNSYRDKEINGVMRREFGSGVSANVDAMARIGYLYLRDGRWRDEQIIPAEFVAAARAPVRKVVGLPEVDPKRYGNASDHYGLLWWNNADGTLPNVPLDAYWSWGLYESLIVVIPSLDIVVARAGRSWKREWAGHYDVLKPFLEPIAASVKKPTEKSESSAASEAPYPPSPIVSGVAWDPVDKITRGAKGSDNWPITWAADDLLYTAYGDGRGFRPFVEKKLSMGLCTIAGGPDKWRGDNLRAPTAEQTGGGASGPKVSGMLAVNDVLYMLVRNTKNSQLAWSTDRGRTWTWSRWKFTKSFGYPTFLNFGKNYAGARDNFVYIYSPDSDSAYRRADRMVLARVPRDRIRDQRAYEFFVRLESDGPRWARDIDQRGAVFTHQDSCYRSSVSYNAALRRYLWCQTGAGGDTRFRGGLAIYDAPEPWGPWTTVYHTSRWDVGPGETSCLPTKWMSDDGRTVHLVFSGDDAFSVRKATLQVRDPDGKRP